MTAEPGQPAGESATTPVDLAVERRARALARFRAFQILLALGVMSAVVGSGFSVSLAFALRPGMQALPPGLWQVAVIALMRLWVLVVAPLAAWAAARILGYRPWATAFAIAGWGEAVFVIIDLSVSGWSAGVYRDAAFFTGRVVTLALGMTAGWLLARRGSAAAARVKARMESEAEATRARYAKWLDEQGRQGPST